MSKLISLLLEKSTSRFLVFCAVMSIILIISAVIPLYPNDFFPYVRIGDEIVRTGHIPTTEFMTFTQFGNPAVYLFWLPSLIFYEVFTIGGVTLTSLVSLIIIGLFYLFLCLSFRELKINLLISAIIMLVIGLVNFNFFLTRPQLFSYPLFSLALWLIIRWQNGKNRFLWMVPVIAIFWANIHASFIVLFLILIPALIFGKGKRKLLLIYTIIALLVTLINYYGFNLWVTMFNMVNNQSIKQFSVEWQAPVNRGWQLNIFYFLLLVIPLIASRAKTRITLLYWIWFLGFGWMAINSRRYIIWFLPVEAVLISMMINPLEEKFKLSKRFQNRSVNLLIGLLLLILPLAFLPGIRNQWWQNSPAIYSEMTPVKATEWLQQNPHLSGELWSDYTFSSYLTYALPQRKVFVTNRFEDFPPAQLDENQKIVNAQYDWQAIVDKYRINLIMASVKQQSDLIKAAESSVEWTEVFRDDQSVIFLRKLPNL